MIHVDSADARQPAPVFRDSNADTARNSDVFAMIFASLRESNQKLSESIHSQQDCMASGSRRQKRLAEMLSKPDRSDHLDESQQPRYKRKSGRVQRLKEASQGSGDQPERVDGNSRPQVTSDDQAATIQEQSLSYDERSTDSEDQSESKAVRDNEATPVQEQQSSETSHESTTTANASPVVSTQAQPPAANTSMTSIMGSGTGSSEEGVPLPVQRVQNPTSLNLQNQSSGNNASNSSQGSGQVNTGKTANTSAQSAGTQVDFQNVLETATRSQNKSAVRVNTSQVLSGKNEVSKGINLNESKSVNELTKVVRSNIGQRHSSMVLRLDPPELGKMRIDMRMHDQTLNLRIQVQNQAGYEALQGRLVDLRTALEQHGIQLNQVDLEIRPQTASPTGPQDNHTQQQQMLQWDGQGAADFGNHGDRNARQDSFYTSPDSGESMPAYTGLESGENQEGVHEIYSAETGVDLIV